MNIWQQRKCALMKAMNFTRDRFAQQTLTNSNGGNDQAISPNSAELVQLLDQLMAFTNRLFDYFYCGFYVEKNLQLSSEYPPAYVLGQILNQASSDLAVITQILNQRLIDFPAQLASGQAPTPQQAALARADYLAAKALAPAIDLNLVEGGSMVTYLQKLLTIRTVPYAPVVLIGIPYTSIGVARDYLAIPHEIGHYVYWHGRQANQPLWYNLDKQLQKTALDEAHNWVAMWQEEIFADVYGSLVAGPILAQSAQDLELSTTQQDFVGTDGEHPSPVLRPRIYLKVLSQMGDFYREWAHKLDEQWQARLRERVQNGGCPGLSMASFDQITLPDGAKLWVDDVISEGIDLDCSKPVDYIIQQCLNLLGSLPEHANFWLSASATEDDLYENFEKWLENVSGNDQTNPALPSPCLGRLLRKWEALGQDACPPWRYVLENGWADKGPHGRH